MHAMARSRIDGLGLRTLCTIKSNGRKFDAGDLEKDCESMHFNASPSSQKLMMELVDAANDICILNGVCAWARKYGLS